MTFQQKFDIHSRWRRDFSMELQQLADWLIAHDFRDAAIAEKIDQLRQRLREDKVMVAFVAEFSRGKSELINSVFFAEFGRRIMPASAGRTTMCPTELGYDPDLPPCLRLLPIQTRLSARSLNDWRNHPEEWTTVPLDVSDADTLAASMARVAEVDRVKPEQAQALGFWLEADELEGGALGDDGLVEVPRWRHALINIGHPLLKQGLVILDTPGLNAIGAEPELTVSLLPQAHSVVFILGADTGVTQSDLRIWREHLLPSGQTESSRLVVLNKIDTLWDELSTAEQIERQIQRQRDVSAQILHINPEQVMAVSAQKGLVAKINGDESLLASSHIPELEQALVQRIITQRQALLTSSIEATLNDLISYVGRVTQARVRDLTEQLQELESIRGKNTSVIKHMRLRIEQEQQEFDKSGARIQAVRSVHLKLLKNLFDVLSDANVRQEVTGLIERLREPGLKWGVKKTYEQTFDQLRQLFDRSNTLVEEIANMLTNTFAQLNAELGLSLQVPPKPDLSKYIHNLDEIEHSHVQYLSVGHIIKLTQSEFTERLGRALVSRLRSVYETASNDLELWNKSCASQLDVQLRDRRKNYIRRVEAVARIQDAAGGLDERMNELHQQIDDLNKQRNQCHFLAHRLLRSH